MARPQLPIGVVGLLLMALIGFATLLRFVNVTQSPPGFYIDEAAISAQVICVKQSGENLQGQKWPLLSDVLDGGYLTPSYLYPAVAWTSVFGDDIASFRSFTAFFSLLFIVGSFVLGLRFWQSAPAAWLCALSAALSPWVFQFARIAWDPSLAPAYTVWAFVFLWASGKYRTIELCVSGLLFSVAAYCYPPLRVQLAIMMPLAMVGLIFIWKRDWRLYLIPIVTATLASLPLLELTLSGVIQARFEMLSIFNHDYLMRTYGTASFNNGLKALFHNFSLLLSPSYLVLRGDANLRHSTGAFGVWSWLDVLGISAAIAVFAMILSRRSKIKIAKFEVLFVIVGYLAGLLPAALTWESNPHALRSFGAVIFLVLGVGGGLSLLWRHSRRLQTGVVGFAFVSFLLFARVYFFEYPKIAGLWFDASVVDLAKRLSLQNRLLEMNDVLRANGFQYEPMAVSYYQLAGGVFRCPLKKTPESH